MRDSFNIVEDLTIEDILYIGILYLQLFSIMTEKKQPTEEELSFAISIVSFKNFIERTINNGRFKKQKELMVQQASESVEKEQVIKEHLIEQITYLELEMRECGIDTRPLTIPTKEDDIHKILYILTLIEYKLGRI
jgi:hypothetical protein